jgi:hypothetical protein
MSGTLALSPAEPVQAPWVAAYATGAAEAVASGLGLLDGDDVTCETVVGPPPGMVLEVRADPPRAVRALRWSTDTGWRYSVDPTWRVARRWFPLPVDHDAEPVALAEVVAGITA